VLDLALFAKLDQLAERILDRNLRVDPVELIERNSFQMPPTQTHLNALVKIFGPADRSRLR